MDLDKIYQVVAVCTIVMVPKGFFTGICPGNFQVCTFITYPTVIPDYTVPTSTIIPLVIEV